jgi:hypothetical protein
VVDHEICPRLFREFGVTDSDCAIGFIYIQKKKFAINGKSPHRSQDEWKIVVRPYELTAGGTFRNGILFADMTGVVSAAEPFGI